MEPTIPQPMKMRKIDKNRKFRKWKKIKQKKKYIYLLVSLVLVNQSNAIDSMGFDNILFTGRL